MSIWSRFIFVPLQGSRGWVKHTAHHANWRRSFLLSNRSSIRPLTLLPPSTPPPSRRSAASTCFPNSRCRGRWRGRHMVSPGGQLRPHPVLPVGRGAVGRRRSPGRGHSEPDELRHVLRRPGLRVREERGGRSGAEGAGRHRHDDRHRRRLATPERRRGVLVGETRGAGGRRRRQRSTPVISVCVGVLLGWLYRPRCCYCCCPAGH